MPTVGKFDVVDPGNLAGDKALLVDWYQMVAWASYKFLFLLAAGVREVRVHVVVR